MLRRHEPDPDMNLILLSSQPATHTFPAASNEARHIANVLRMRAGDVFDVGCVNGPRGKATILRIDPEGAVHTSIAWLGEPAAPVYPLILAVGFPRPQAARRVLNTAATLGVARMVFFRSDKGERAYAESKLWSTGEWERHLHEGAEQAFATSIPEVARAESLVATLDGNPADMRLALDNYEATEALPTNAVVAGSQMSAMVAIGAERGWSAAERNLLRERSFRICHLGPRVLRVETACVAAIARLVAY